MISISQINKIKNKALTLQKTHNTNNPELIAKYLDVEILYRPYKKQLGAFTLINKVPFIFVNENITYEERKNVIAHELGHFLLHKQLIKDILILRDYGLFSKRESEMETEANLFASYLLIDITIYNDLKKQNKSNKEIAKNLNVNLDFINLIDKYS